MLVPAAPGSSELGERAGVDLVHDLPSATGWVCGLPGSLVIGNYVYADGATNVRVSTAVDALTNLSLDPEAQRIAWERDRNERGWRHMIGSAREEGQRTGKAATLTLQLRTKFGTLAEEHRHRIEAADEATLDRWCAAIFVAASVDELLGL